ncbi:MAG: vacuolar-type H+-ATPase subunit H [Oscillospiraceae bacterium]|nr:vacuolar-type H+-ATPase subunit H [Oscillospiraceae bacterium]
MNNKVDEILDELDEVLDKARPFPFGGGKYIADVERLRELVNDVRLNMPYEIKEARIVAFDRDRVLNEAKAKAESIISQAEKRAAVIASETAIVKEAKKMAVDVLKKAQNNANEVKRAANEYVDNLMNNTEKFMNLSLQDVRKQKQTIRENRK